jgi:hypothetical protein
MNTIIYVHCWRICRCANTGGQGSQLAECDVTTAPLPVGTERTEPAGAETSTAAEFAAAPEFATAPDSGSSQRKMKENMKLNLAKVSRIHLDIHQKKILNCFIHRVHAEWQRPLSGVHSIMKEKLVRVAGGARPPSFTLFTITYKVAVYVYAPGERADTLTLFHLYP